MQPLAAAIRNSQTTRNEQPPNNSPALSNTPSASSPQTTADPHCPLCAGCGWYARRKAPGEYADPKFLSGPFSENGQQYYKILIKCRACYDWSRQTRYLASCSMLYGNDLDITFDRYWADIHGEVPRAAVQKTLARHGWLVFTGPYGAGKSFMLKAMVNEARNAGALAVYTTLANLLDQLRRAFDPKENRDHVELWENLLSAQVVAIDELDKFNTTDWAMERLQMLVERRYCDWHDKATVFALNNWMAIPGYIRSRLADRSRCMLVEMQGQDLRQKT